MNNSPQSDALPPGTYLRLRRIAHGLTLGDLARQLVALPFARPGPLEIFINRMTARLRDAETGAEHLLPAQAALLAQILPFEPQVYERLIALASTPGLSLPVPQLCRACGCSWHMACTDHLGAPCSWCLDDSTLCTSCARKMRNRSAPLHVPHGPIPPRAARHASGARA